MFYYLGISYKSRERQVLGIYDCYGASVPRNVPSLGRMTGVTDASCRVKAQNCALIFLLKHFLKGEHGCQPGTAGLDTYMNKKAIAVSN